jgi:hypothetical protein
MKLRISILLIVLLAALVAGACGGESLSSDKPPWGLDGIAMPDTESDVVGVFAVLPREIDGRPLSGGGPGGYWAMYGESDVAWTISAMPSELLENPGPGIETPAKWVTDFASRPGGATVDASAVDLGGDVVWVAFSAVLEDTSEEPPRGGPIYMLAWAKPDGSWAFSLQADSEAGRVALAEAFVNATGGPTSWVVNALVIAIVLAVGWWVARYARSVSRGNYRHPKDVKQVWWLAGAGGHGGGGQVPPLIPDPDPEDEIR